MLSGRGFVSEKGAHLMPINPFPESNAKQILRIRDADDIASFRGYLGGAKLNYFGMPSAELLDILEWREHISSFTAVEIDSDVYSDIETTVFINKLDQNHKLILGDVCEVLVNSSFDKYELFNLDFYGGFVYKKKDGSASNPTAIEHLVRWQAQLKGSFLLIITFNLRDKDQIEYERYIKQIENALKGYRGTGLTENIEFHLSKGKPTNVYKLKICVPTTVYVAGLPHYDFTFRRVYHYKTFVHFVLEMRYIEGEALGNIPSPDVLIDILNKPIFNIEGKHIQERKPAIPQIALIDERGVSTKALGKREKTTQKTFPGKSTRSRAR